MLKKTFLLFFLLFLPFFVHSKTYYLSICAIFQNEAPYLKEWIEFHRLIGVKHFWLYNNNSTDHYKKVLKPYIKKKIVDLIDWPSPKNEDWTPHQARAYNDCIARVKSKTKWLAIIDLDEFIVPISTKTLPKLLKNYEKVGGLQIFWQFFGTGGFYKIPKNKTLIESLVLKAPRDWGPNYNYKTICQPSVVKEFGVHGGDYHAPWYAIFPHGTRGGAHQPIHLDIVRIHHYWARDELYLRKEKVPRRERYEGGKYSEDRIQALIHDMNQEKDTSILRYVPALKARLGLGKFKL